VVDDIGYVDDNRRFFATLRNPQKAEANISLTWFIDFILTSYVYASAGGVFPHRWQDPKELRQRP
jgi:hypothetical protein